MSIDATLARARDRMNVRLTDTCRIEAASAGTFDRDTATNTATWTTVYEGRCEFVARVEQSTVRESAGRDVATLAEMLRLPHDVTGISEGQRVTCIGSRNRPEMVGHLAIITGGDFASNHTAVRVGLTTITS